MNKQNGLFIDWTISRIRGTLEGSSDASRNHTFTTPLDQRLWPDSRPITGGRYSHIGYDSRPEYLVERPPSDLRGHRNPYRTEPNGEEKVGGTETERTGLREVRDTVTIVSIGD